MAKFHSYNDDAVRKYITVGFVCVWTVLMVFAIFSRAHSKKYKKPHLQQHAKTAAFLFAKTCIASGLDIEKLEAKALSLGMTPIKDLTVPRDPYGIYTFRVQQIYGGWDIEAEGYRETDWKYEPYPYKIRLEDYRGEALPKNRCSLQMHHGIIKRPSNPYSISRKSRRLYGRYKIELSNILLWILPKIGAEITESSKPHQGKLESRRIAYTLDGENYILNVHTFWITLESGKHTGCITCDLYPQPEIVQNESSPH